MIRVYNTKEDEVFNIPLTPEAARSPQILSSFMKRSQTPPSMTPVASPSVKKALSVFIAVGPEHQEVVQCVPSSGSSFRPMSTREFRVSVSARGSPLQRASFH